MDQFGLSNLLHGVPWSLLYVIRLWWGRCGGLYAYFYNAQNYGAVLQAYALQEIVCKKGYEAQHLRFTDRIYNHDSASIINRVKTIIDLSDGHLYKYIKTRKASHQVSKQFQCFRNRYLCTSQQAYYSLEDLKRGENEYKGFITGSDMVWSDIGQDLEVYFLTFTHPLKRIAYAPSITGTESYTDEKNAKMRNYINGISFLSVRERSGVQYIKKITGRDAFWALDPALLMDKSTWCHSLNICLDKELTEKYLLVYMFDGSSKLTHSIKKFAIDNGLKIRYIPMKVVERYEEIIAGHSAVYGPKEFVELFMNASFVVTNSFHGLVFSLVANAPFALIHRGANNEWHEHEQRMISLLETFGLQDRYITDKSTIPCDFISIDYNKINKIVEEKRQASLEYLYNALDALKNNNTKVKQINKVTDLSNVQCTGCTACMAVCPQKAITLKKNEEGFLFPFIDETKCSNCQKCVRSCHSINKVDLSYPMLTYGAYSKDAMQKDSASGGIFLSLAKFVIESLNGAVCGAVLEKDTLKCKHVIVEKTKDIHLLQNSKYVQSNMENVFFSIKKMLENGRIVLFSGTPCQVAGLLSYIKTDYSNLITVDIVCHGVPSPKFWEWEVNRLHDEYDFDAIKFRSKDNESISRSSFQLKLLKDNVEINRLGVRDDPFYNSFMNGESYRLSCYYCSYAQPNRCSDITIGDLDSWRKYPQFNPDKAKSIVLINSEKGLKIWDNIKELISYISVDYNEEIRVNRQLKIPTEKPERRHELFNDLSNLSSEVLY